ncbi:MAG: radical SAM protein [archaeon]
MKVLALNPPFHPKFSRDSRSPAVSKGGCVYYPIWLGYAAAAMEKAGHKVKLLDCPAESKGLEETLKIAAEFRPEMVVVETSTPSIIADAKAAVEVRKATGAFTVMAGTHASAMPEGTLEMAPGIEAVARREFDYIVRDLANELESGKDSWKSVKGITFRDKDGKIRSNPDMPFIENLDEIPFVADVYKRNLNIRNYFYPSVLFPEVTIITGRGCPNYCTYCVIPQTLNGHRYRTRSVQNLADEFEWIKKNMPEVRDVMIEDDTFTADKKRVREFAEEIKRRGLNITYTINARADVDYETLKALKASGCRLMCVGFESADQQILNNIKKGTVVERIKTFREDAKKAGVLIHGCFMLGNKGETKETIEKTVKWALELDPDTAQFFPIMVYPGTEDYDWFRKNGLLLTEDYGKWLDKEGNHRTLISRPGLSAEELVEKCDEARARFYLRPKYMLKKGKQMLLNPSDIPRTLIASRVFYKHFFGKKHSQKEEKIESEALQSVSSGQSELAQIGKPKE